jgi:hypothetical protein
MAATTPAPYLVSAAASSGLTIGSATAADIPGATITITTAQPNAVVQVSGVFDILTVTAGNIAAVGTCVVDGATQAGQAIFVIITSNSRATVAQNWNVALAAAGSHTIKFQGATSPGVSATFNATHTTLTALVLDW